MPILEDRLAALEKARVEAEGQEAARHLRYDAEDAEVAAARAREDDLHAGGEKVREDMKADIEAQIKKRDAEDAAMSPAAIEDLMARIAFLENMQKEPVPAPVKSGKSVA